MHFEVRCPRCADHFSVLADPAMAESLNQVAEEGPWATLGDGETFEDRLQARLGDGSPLHCPACGEAVVLSEETLGRLTMAVLANW